MSKKFLLALCLLSLNNIACASQDGNSMENVQSSASDIQPEEASGSATAHPEGKLIGNVTVPYRYQTEADVKQTLGYLQSKTQSTLNDTSSASDISPQEDLVSPEPIQPKPPAKTKKAVKKIKKPTAKKVIKPEQSVSNTAHTAPTSVVKQDNPVMVNEPLSVAPKNNHPIATAPIATPPVMTVNSTVTTAITNEPLTDTKPVENVGVKNTDETSSEQNKAAPIQSDTIVAPQEPAQPNPPINTAPEVSTILEFNQSDVDLSSSHKTALLEIASKLKGQQNFILKLQSYGSVVSSDLAEARRLSLQRAIKVRKFLIENEVNPNNISVNAVEDSVNKSNKIEIKIEKNS